MEYAEEDYLMISGIQHFEFCKRQWALIHVEQQWEENVHTVVGKLMHKKVHDPYLTEKRNQQMQTDCSWLHRHYVLKKCFPQQ